MPNTTTSTFMLLPVPIPGVDPGPTWATDVNTCLTTIDSHDHSTNKGTPINPSGISINADLPFGTHNATGLRSARFTAGSILSTGSDIGCLYVSGVDLYYNDVNGNQVKMTASGAVAGTPGSIGNLLSPASVTYNSGTSTFVFQSTTATAANLDAGSLTVRNLTANSKGISIQAPAGLANSYSFVLPANLPSSGSSQKILTIDQNGNLFDAYDVDNTTLVVTTNLIGIKPNSVGITQLKTFNIAASSSSGDSAITTSSSYVNVPNLQATILSSGRPLRVELQYDNLGSTPVIGITGAAGANGSLQLLRNANTVSQFVYVGNNTGSGTNFAGGFVSYTDCNPVPASSSYTYYMQYKASLSGSMECRNVNMVVYEI